MASMDTGDGPSRSGRGGGQWQNNRGGGYNNHNNYNNYNNNRGRGSNRGYSSPGNRGSYNNGYSASGYNTSGYSNQGYGPGAGGRQAWGGRGRGRGRGRAAGRGPLHFPDPEDIKFLKVMKGHTKKVTSIALNPDAQQIYTGSADRTLRVWHMETGQCIQTIDAGGEVDSMLLSGKMLIVGLHVSNEEGMVRAWHIDLGTDLVLPGRHRGAVLCLAQAAQLLFSGGQDTTIKVWSFDAASQAFQPLVELSQARGGHDSSVQCITVDQQYLYSADWHGCIKVWGMQQGQCLQTIPSAHGPSATPNYAGLVMGLLPYQGYLLSCALDGSVKVWAPCETPQPNAVLESTPNYSHPSSSDAGQREEYGGVLAMCGTSDSKQSAVVLTSHSQENIIRMHGLPDFEDRGQLSAIKDARALAAVPGGLIVAGDAAGTVKTWQWR
ncbi:hypothetical protein ABBQ32_009100 [Trebouxia sp. C0010 RCD-2024]